MKLAPQALVAREVARALFDIARLPLRLQDYFARHEALRARVTADLSTPRTVENRTARFTLPARPLKIFVSCAEASGEIHAQSVVGALREQIAALGGPEPELVGLGGEKLAACDVRLIGRPVDRAAMGLSGILPALPFYLGLLTDSARELANGGCDLFLPIDSPALHVPLAHMAQHYGVPVVHFVTPQYWGWAPWRVDGYRRAVDRALTILPFEPAWFERNGLDVEHVGHPLLDALQGVERAAETPSSNVLAILPGSRSSVIRFNLPWMLRCVELIARRIPDLEPVIAHDGERHRALLEEIVGRSGCADRVKIETTGLHATLRRARAAFSVSGTILIDLLHHRLPTVTLYRVHGRRGSWMYRNLLTAPFFASVNLLVGRELYPEFCFHGDGPIDEVVDAVEAALADDRWRAECLSGLEEAARNLGPPGAAGRAAGAALELVAGTTARSQIQSAASKPLRKTLETAL